MSSALSNQHIGRPRIAFIDADGAAALAGLDMVGDHSRRANGVNADSRDLAA